MKRIQVIRDSKGEVIGTAELARDDKVPVSFELEKGQKLEEIEVPDRYVIDEMKRIQIIRDSKWEVIGTAELAQDDEIPVSVELEKGQEIEVIEVSGRYILWLDTLFKGQVR